VLKEEVDEKFQVLINQEENVSLHNATYKKYARNHVNEDQEMRNIETGREERRLDQELVDCC